MKGKRLIFSISLLVIVIGIAVPMFLEGNRDGENREANTPRSSGGLFLALAEEPQLPGTTFLEKEAGISVYANVGEAIDLSQIKGGFKAIEKETDEYIIGSIKTTGVETEDAHCYVNKDGWLVAYYPKSDPIAKIIYWGNPQVTKLEKGLTDLAAVIGLSLTGVKYYDFRYPKAQKLMIIFGSGETGFKIKIPSGLLVYERSFSFYPPLFVSWLFLDESEIGSGHGYREVYGTISPNQLKPDIFHTVKGGHEEGKFAIVLAYSE